MCGVVGLVYERPRADLGRVAAELLKTLEYRGYDSTGAAIQAEDEAVDLRKDVGAPSVMVEQLGIVRLPGQILCGQVRWATFGAVDRTNAQPHVVRCHTYLYGAHNGNVTNSDELKLWLTAQGHQVVSDNDGEMVVHTVEHFFAARLARLPESEIRSASARRKCMRAALLEASRKLAGSFAAVIVDPVSRCVWAIKRGSSLYFGIGSNDTGGFGVASSDLSSVLKVTRLLVPLTEGDVVEFDGKGHQLYHLRPSATDSEAPESLERGLVRSRLRARDTGLNPPFSTFMEQEIAAETETAAEVVRLFSGGSTQAQAMERALAPLGGDFRQNLHERLIQLLEAATDTDLKNRLDNLLSWSGLATLRGQAPALFSPIDAAEFRSGAQGILADLLGLNPDSSPVLRAVDAYLENEESREFGKAVEAFVDRCHRAHKDGHRIFLLSCGTSYHASKAAALFFHELAGADVIPLLPGEFRGQFAQTIRDGDIVVAVSQSGETKDLIDVINDVIRSQKDVFRVALVNNVNSTLGQEKSHLVIPLRCGPEIAVAATKSFINQLVVFYGLALRLAQKKGLSPSPAGFEAISGLISETLVKTNAALDEAAGLLHLAPSIHILATRLVAVAKEGALKIREVVLNHTEGFEGSEFKHGPNTILGVNTLFGPAQLAAHLDVLAEEIIQATQNAPSAAAATEAAAALLRSVWAPKGDSGRAPDRVFEALYADYPLIFVTGPDPRDLDLTVSQINTHKIRGATTIMIAEDNPRLRATVEKAPADNPNYRSVFVALPKTGDTLSTVFSATVALQRLALKMSLKKAAYLDTVGIKDHGVHPDVPKNVSKSITVD